MSELPSSTALDTAGQMLWLMIEPVEATLNVYNPWSVVILALILSLIPLPRRLGFRQGLLLKGLGAGFLTYLAYMFRPLAYQLSPIWPDPYEVETYVRLALLMSEAFLIIALSQALIERLKTPDRLRLKAPGALPSVPQTQISFVFQRPRHAPDQAGLNFTQKVAAPVSLALTQTLSVPHRARTLKTLSRADTV